MIEKLLDKEMVAIIGVILLAGVSMFTLPPEMQIVGNAISGMLGFIAGKTI